MKLREAKKWLRATPSARRLAHYDKALDQIVFTYAPQLAGQDVMLAGESPEYPTEIAATLAATRFQDAVRSNHPACDPR